MSVLFLICCVSFATCDKSLPDALNAALPSTAPHVELRKLEESETILLQRFTQSALQNRVASTLAAELKTVGWTLNQYSHKGSNVWLLVEADESGFGRGVLAVRADSSNRFFVQAPHRFYDSRTGQIGIDWFLKTNLRMAFWNTAHRKQIDLAHSKNETVLDLLTTTFDSQIKDGLVVQLHGFATAKRKTQIAREAEVILSGGTVEPVEAHYNARLFVRRALPDCDVLLYPTDVKALGATTNKQRQILPRPESFLHIELNTRLRQRLAEDSQLSVEILKQLFQLHRI